ncbi:MAG: dihydroneopterin aldolase [bacterium]
MDIIRLQNMTFYAYHGVSAAEKETGRRYEVDCELHLDLTQAAKSDKLGDTVNYAEVYQTVEQVLQERKYSLIESVCAEICRRLLAMEMLNKVVVRVRKKMPPIPGNLDHIEVEMMRESN